MANTTNLDLVKPLGTDRALVSVINANMDKIDNFAGNVEDSFDATQDGMAIVANGDTHAAISAGQFVYVKNHNTLAEGLYTASTAIAQDAALSTSNLTADTSGGLNALNSNLSQVRESTTISGSSLSDVQSGIVTLASTMSDYSVRQIRFSLSSNSGEIIAATYYGKVTRHSSTIFVVEAQAVDALAENSLIGTYRNNGWTWNKLALNSKMPTGTAYSEILIPSGSNLNSYTTPGTYIVPNDSTAGSITNMPRSASGRLVVMYRTTSDYLMQEYYPTTGPSIVYARNYNNGTWSEWAQRQNIEIEAVPANSSVTINLTARVPCLIAVGRASTSGTGRLALVDAWGGLVNLVTHTSYTLSISNNVLTITNSGNSYASAIIMW